jgi:VanZ family protein
MRETEDEARRTTHGAPGTTHEAPGTTHEAPGTTHEAPGTGTAHGAQRTQHGFSFVWGPAVALMAAIFLVSSVPHLDTSESGISDKSLHSWTYAALGALLARALAGAAWAGVTARAAALAWAYAVLWGGFDELHQSFVPGRSLSGADWLADAIGAAAGIVAVLALARLRPRNRAV